MFSAAIANLLQYFSFPAEVIGVLLAYIEIRHPGLSRLLSARITDYGKRNAEVSLRDNIPAAGVIATIAVFVLFSVVIVVVDPPDWVIYGPLAVLILVSAALLVAAYWVPRRALGTIGLMIAGLGLLIELYQMLALASDPLNL